MTSGDDDDLTPVEALARHGDPDVPTLRDGPRDHSPGLEESDPLALPRGTTLGRYVVLERLGSGGMGVVFAAYDPQLDRRIALKLLRSADNADGGTGGRARILREAQAMARLSHPNVIAVHDVGVVDGRLFIAMEFIDGQTLGAWTKGDQRTWVDVLDVFESAAKGLAAAHVAGLVHRDFKPDNVMLDDAGRVRVMDFGLARATTEVTTEASISDDSNTALSMVDRLTRTGALVGTPAYMSPELLAGGPADARSDQYAYCVALYRALYGVRPFEGKNVATLYANALAGIYRPAKAGTAVPRWLSTVVKRGLAPKADDRFESMDELLAAVARGRGRRSRLLLGAIAATLVGTGAVGWVFAAGKACTGGKAQLAKVWGDQHHAALRTAFDSSGAPDAEGTAHRIEGVLDEYAIAWTASHRKACEAARAGEQSDNLLDLRMACLQRRLTDLDAAVTVLQDADKDLVLNAADVALSVPGVDRCEDTARLVEHNLAADDEATRQEADRLRAKLSQARALDDAGRNGPALELARPLAAEADALGFRPLSAEVYFALGALLFDADEVKEAAEMLERATFEAEASGHDEIAARAWTVLTFLHGFRNADPEKGDAAAKRAEAAVIRAGSRPDLMANVIHNRATLFLQRGDYERALKEQREALRLRLEHYGEFHPEVGESYSSVGNALYHLGRPEEAMELYNKAFEVLSAVVGPRHPSTGTALQNIGNMLTVTGDPDGARERLGEALAIFEEAYGSEHPQVGQVLFNLGWAAERAGDYEQGLDALERARVIELARVGPEHPLVGEYEASIGILAHKIGRETQARSHLERSIAIFEKAHGPAHSYVARSLNDLALVDKAEGDLVAAERRHRRALSIRRAALPSDHPELADSLSNLTQILYDARRYKEALPLMQELVKIRAQHVETDPDEHVEALARLADLESALQAG